MQDNEIRKQIVDEARSYLGVKFCHQGRSHRGVDCAGLIYCVYDRVVKLEKDYDHYPSCLKSGMIFRKMRDYGDRIDKQDAGSGDVVLMCFRGSSTHLGILTEHGVIHADGPIGKVIEHSISKSSMLGNGRIAAYFRMKGVPAWRE